MKTWDQITYSEKNIRGIIKSMPYIGLKFSEGGIIVKADVLRAIKTAKLTEKEFGAVMAVKSGMSVKEYARRINSTEDAVRGAFRGACRKISAVLQG